MQKIIVTIIIIGIMLLGAFLSGCTTAGTAVADAQLIADGARASERVAAIYGELTDIIGRNAERSEFIRRKAEGIRDGLARMEYLLDCYDEEIRRRDTEIISLREQVAQYAKNSMASGGLRIPDDPL